MTENMKNYLVAVSKNDELFEKSKSMGKEEIFATAKTLGIELTEADFASISGELDDDELDAVAGGGTADNNDYTCACVLTGAGQRVKGAKTRCVCVGAGGGTDT